MRQQNKRKVSLSFDLLERKRRINVFHLICRERLEAKVTLQ